MRKSKEFLLQLVIFGATAAVVSLLVARIYPTKLINSFKESKQNQISQVVAEPTILPPTSITIPQLTLNLSVAPAKIVDNQWTLYDDKVSWLATSKTPGKGNVILFAHNRDNLFGNLKTLAIGQEITVGDGSNLYTYEVTQSRRVTPSDVDAVLSDENQLTLYTCDGSFDQKRLIVIALPKAKNKV